MVIGDVVVITGGPNGEKTPRRTGVYWFKSGGPFGLLVVIVRDGDCWRPEYQFPERVQLQEPRVNIVDEMPIWAI